MNVHERVCLRADFVSITPCTPCWFCLSHRLSTTLHPGLTLVCTPLTYGTMGAALATNASKFPLDRPTDSWCGPVDPIGAESSDVPMIVDVYGRPALHRAVLSGDETCLATLLANGVHPDTRDMDGYTALMHASKAGHTSMVDRLLAAGASTERHAYRTGDTAMILACRDGISSDSEEPLAWSALLAHGAEPYRTNWGFHAPRGFLDGPRRERFDDLVSAKGWPRPDDAPLKNSPQELAERLELDRIWVQHCGCEVGPCSCVSRLDAALDSGRTLLQTAAQEGLPCVLHGLLEAGATPDARPHGDPTALVLAATRNYPVIVSMLLDHNASIDAADGDGVTALQVACFAGFLEVARLLLWRGADVMATDHKGIRCRHLVDSRHAGSPLQILIDHAEREAAGTSPERSSNAGSVGSNDTIFVSRARAQAAASVEGVQSPLGVAVALVLVALCLVHRQRRRSAPLPPASTSAVPVSKAEDSPSRRRSAPLPPASTSAVPVSKAEDDPSCVVCLERPRCAVVLPCKHLSLCEACAAGLTSCPMCRGHVEEIMVVFV